MIEERWVNDEYIGEYMTRNDWVNTSVNQVLMNAPSDYKIWLMKIFNSAETLILGVLLRKLKDTFYSKGSKTKSLETAKNSTKAYIFSQCQFIICICTAL